MNDIHHLLTRCHFPRFPHFPNTFSYCMHLQRKKKKDSFLFERLTLLTVHASVCLGHSSSWMENIIALKESQKLC